MTFGPFYLGQVPGEPLVITVTNFDGTERDLTTYASISLAMRNGAGAAVDTSAGTIDPPAEPYVGTVTYHFPNATLFATVGEYGIRLVLDGPGAVHDLTEWEAFSVLDVEANPPLRDKDVLLYLGSGAENDPDTTALMAARRPIVETFVRAYTRGAGFTNGIPCSELAAVITTAAAREVSTSPGVTREEIGGYSAYYAVDPSNFTLREMLVLNQYRRRAA